MAVVVAVAVATQKTGRKNASSFYFLRDSRFDPKENACIDAGGGGAKASNPAHASD